MANRSVKSALRTVALYIVVVIIALYIMIPIYWVISSSLQPELELVSVPPRYIPRVLTLENYLYIFFTEAMLKARVEAGTFGSLSVGTMAGYVSAAITNSTITAISVVIINLIFGTLGAYVLARGLITGSGPLFIAMLCSRLMPAIAIIIPYYVIIRSLGLLDNILSLVLIYSAVTIPFSVWILMNYLSGIPTDIEESALVDGYSMSQVLVKVVYPLIKPGLVSVGIMSFMLSYVEFFFAFIITQTNASHTIPVVIGMLATNQETLLSLTNAAAVVAMIPPMIIVIVFRRYIIRGLTAGAIVRG